MALDQGRAKRGLDVVALGERQVPQAADGIDPLGKRDGDADLAELGDHAFEGGEHGLPVTFRTCGTFSDNLTTIKLRRPDRPVNLAGPIRPRVAAVGTEAPEWFRDGSGMAS